MKPRLAILLVLVLVLTAVLVSSSTTAGPSLQQAAPKLPATGSGGTVEALVTIGNRQRALAPNKLGLYPRFVLAENARVRVELRMPNAAANDRVTVGTMDGGRILVGEGAGAMKAPSTQLMAGADSRVRFTFEAGKDHGVYRVLARRGRETRVFEFWVGPRPPANTRRMAAN